MMGNKSEIKWVRLEVFKSTWKFFKKQLENVHDEPYGKLKLEVDNAFKVWGLMLSDDPSLVEKFKEELEKFDKKILFDIAKIKNGK